jgi:hypothetical protein
MMTGVGYSGGGIMPEGQMLEEGVDDSAEERKRW